MSIPSSDLTPANRLTVFQKADTAVDKQSSSIKEKIKTISKQIHAEEPPSNSSSHTFSKKEASSFSTSVTGALPPPPPSPINRPPVNLVRGAAFIAKKEVPHHSYSSDNFLRDLKDPESLVSKLIFNTIKNDYPRGTNGTQLEITVSDFPGKNGKSEVLKFQFIKNGANFEVKAFVNNEQGIPSLCLHTTHYKASNTRHLEWIGQHPGEKINLKGGQLLTVLDSFDKLLIPSEVTLADVLTFTVRRGDDPENFPTLSSITGPYASGKSYYVSKGYKSENPDRYEEQGAILKNYTMKMAIESLSNKVPKNNNNKSLETLLSDFAEAGIVPNENETVGQFYQRLAAATVLTNKEQEEGVLSRKDVYNFYEVCMKREVEGDNETKIKNALTYVGGAQLSKKFEG
ncbi:MAG: hypothetical protein LW832_08505 [Parachlamydia sp.]|jgi:hypothetical protein|nr:hypothetical protein [Parachlamydia sp.]